MAGKNFDILKWAGEQMKKAWIQAPYEKVIEGANGEKLEIEPHVIESAYEYFEMAAAFYRVKKNGEKELLWDKKDKCVGSYKMEVIEIGSKDAVLAAYKEIML